MTGGSSDECGLHTFRVTSNASSLAISGSNTTSSCTNMGITGCGKVSSLGLHGLALSSANNNAASTLIQHRPKQEISLMDLPAELLGHIFSFVGFKKIAQMRVILDEVYSVLRYIRTSPSLDRPFKVTDELFDLSTMAMEYFKEHIEPNLPDIAYFTNSTKSFAVLEPSSSIMSRDTSHSSSSSPPQSNMVLRKGIRKIKQGMKRYNNQLTVLRSELRTCRRKATEQAKTITEQQKLLAEQQKQTLEFANRLDETDKKNEELSRKFSTVLQKKKNMKKKIKTTKHRSGKKSTIAFIGAKSEGCSNSVGETSNRNDSVFLNNSKNWTKEKIREFNHQHLML
ncbi:hypothetical protein ZHAS_00015895 [Anopheles sinensis]|uniref:F-box domain-containing protein n=1 Tax=Anopheles sinensis TaxID=74873 RepID=A0A084WCA3_ANOSI|nr:hypothetical protein ZHAS_00015895 [Anopheles sinensis]